MFNLKKVPMKMKNFIFMLFMSFAVIAFAAPPPDLVPDNIPDRVEFVVQQNVNSVVYTVDVQEVMFNYLGDYELVTCSTEYFEQVDEAFLPKATITDISYMQLNELNKPPAFNQNQQVINFNPDKQHSNYGYPLTGDTCRS